MTELTINGYPLPYVLWNLFLALVPCYAAWKFSQIAKESWGKSGMAKKAGMILLFLVWLFFLPNAAYLITMVRHLIDYCADSNIYHVCVQEGWMVPFFFMYAAMGIPTFWYALKKMTNTLKKWISPKLDPAFPLLMMPVTAFGVMLGLFPRLNSWQIVTDPLAILGISLDYLTDPVMLINFLAYTVALGVLYYGVEAFYRKKPNFN